MDNTKTNTVGVVIGRFQTPFLHEAHHELLKLLTDKYQQVIIFVGVASTKNTKTDPLDFDTRAMMIREWMVENSRFYNTVSVLPIYDHESDIVWSRNLDNQISSLVGFDRKVVLLGSRDSFIGSYYGRYETKQVDIVSPVSGTEIRKKCVIPINSEDFRDGVIYATNQRYPVAYQVVDMAIWDSMGRILMIKKEGDGNYWRFPGGFSDPNSESLEHDARREIQEELGLNVEYDKDLKYIGSCLIDDWRYRKGPDKVKSAFFATEYLWGLPVANDDALECGWVKISDLMNVVRPSHKVLAEKFIVWYNDQGK